MKNNFQDVEKECILGYVGRCKKLSLTQCNHKENF